MVALKTLYASLNALYHKAGVQYIILVHYTTKVLSQMTVYTDKTSTCEFATREYHLYYGEHVQRFTENCLCPSEGALRGMIPNEYIMGSVQN